MLALLGASYLRGHFGQIIGLEDWDSWYQLQWASYRAVHDFHQLPLWNPYRCGGMPLLANPESHIATPWFLLTLLFGPFAGLQLEIPIFMAIAWAGGYVLGRTLKLRPIPSLAPAFLFASSSWLYERAVSGQISMLAFVYLPWIIAAAWRACEPARLRYVLPAGALLGLIFLEGGPYPFAISVVSLGLVLAARMPLRQRTAAIAGAIVLLAAAFAAFKLFPAVVLAIQHPRIPTDTQINTLAVLRTALFSINQAPYHGCDNGWGFWETGAYVGLFCIPALFGLFDIRRAIPWALTAFVLFALARGDAGWLWPLLHKAPIFDSLRLPSRFLIPLTLMVGVLAGFGLQWLWDRPWGNAGRVAAIALLAGASANAMMVGIPLLSQIVNDLKQPRQPAPAFAQVGLGPDNNKQLLASLDNHGVVHCYAYIDWPTSVAASDESGYRGEQYPEGPGAVTLLRWSPGVLTYQVDFSAPGVLVVNQNYDSAWRLHAGNGTVLSENNLLAIRLPQGSQRIELWYVSTPAIAGLIVSILAVFAGIAAWILLGRHPDLV